MVSKRDFRVSFFVLETNQIMAQKKSISSTEIDFRYCNFIKKELFLIR